MRIIRFFFPKRYVVHFINGKTMTISYMTFKTLFDTNNYSSNTMFTDSKNKPYLYIKMSEVLYIK